jgi:hypothetical protein
VLDSSVGLAAASAAVAARALRRRAGDAGAVPMSITEFRTRATGAGGLERVTVRLKGQVTEAPADGLRVLSRWVHSCCAQHEAPVSVDVRGLTADVGSWVELDARWVAETGRHGTNPAVEATRWRVLATPPARLEA